MSNRSDSPGRREAMRPIRDRRRAPRVAIRVPGEIVDGPEAIAVSSVNLSTVGILCETPRALPLFHRYRILIEVPGAGGADSRRIPVDAVVVRVEESKPPARHLAALFFEKMADDDRIELERFLVEQIPPSAAPPTSAA